jgi:hypothetical protein
MTGSSTKYRVITADGFVEAVINNKPFLKATKILLLGVAQSL